jgi:hypothetical protein
MEIDSVESNGVISGVVESLYSSWSRDFLYSGTCCR